MGELEAEDHDDSDRPQQRSKKYWVWPRKNWTRTAITTLTLAVVGGTMVVLFEYVWVKPAFEPLPNANAPTLTSPQQVPTQQAPRTVNASRKCRSPADAVHAPVDIDPCIALAGDYLEITTRVKSRAPGEVSVHVWVFDVDANDRLEYTLKTCGMTFTAAGQSQDCGPHLVRPNRPGRYQAITGAQEGVAELPVGWENERSGIQSGLVSWP